MKRLPIILASLFSLSSLFAYDFSAVVSDGTTLKFYNGEFKDPELKQTETFTGAFTTPVGGSGLSFFSVEGSVQHKLEKTTGDNSSSKNSVIADFTLFKFSTVKKLEGGKNLQVSAGRFYYSDVTGIVFSQPNDGLYFKYGGKKLEASVYGGYTGLQNVKNVSILTSKGAVWAPKDEKDVYDFSSPYAVGSFFVSAPYFFKNQTISFECMGMFNVAGPADLKDDDNRLYGTICLAGPMSSFVFYSISGTMQTEDFSDFGILGKFSLNYFVPVKNTTVGLNGLYASSSNGKIKAFTGFSKSVVCLSRNEDLCSEIMKFGASASFLPVPKIFVAAGFDTVYKLSGSSTEFYGFQAGISGTYRIFSDLKMSLSLSNFTGKYKEASRTDVSFGLALAL